MIKHDKRFFVRAILLRRVLLRIWIISSDRFADYAQHRDTEGNTVCKGVTVLYTERKRGHPRQSGAAPKEETHAPLCFRTHMRDRHASVHARGTNLTPSEILCGR